MSDSVEKKSDPELFERLSQSERGVVAQVCQKMKACRSLDALKVEIESAFLPLFGAEAVCFGHVAEDLSWVRPIGLWGASVEDAGSYPKKRVGQLFKKLRRKKLPVLIRGEDFSQEKEKMLSDLFCLDSSVKSRPQCHVAPQLGRKMVTLDANMTRMCMCIYKSRPSQEFWSLKDVSRLALARRQVFKSMGKFTARQGSPGTLDEWPLAMIEADDSFRMIICNEAFLELFPGKAGKKLPRELQAALDIGKDGANETDWERSRLPEISVGGIKYLFDKRFVKLREGDADNFWVVRLRPTSAQTAGDHEVLRGLTKRERDVALLLCKGMSVKNTAKELFLSAHTVRSHIKQIHRKLNVSSRTELILILAKK